MDIEKVATSAIENLLSRNSYLRAFINSNDKTPIWDGDIFVYKSKDNKNKNKDLIGKAPIQVKGHEVKKVKDINPSSIKFRVNKDDLIKYYLDGGIIYFVVYIYGDNEKIFYNSLLPLDLVRLLNKYKDQESFMIELNQFPKDELRQADLFLDFIQNKKKQHGTLNDEILYVEDLDKFMGEVKEIEFGIYSVSLGDIIPFKELSTREFYVYAKPKGIGNPIPFDKVSNAIIDVKENLAISIREKVYYNKAFIKWENGIPSIICGKSIKISMPDFEKTDVKTAYFSIRVVGTLNERINDLIFIKDLIETKELSVNKHKILFNDSDFINKQDFLEMLNNLVNIKQRLEYFGVIKDLNLDIMTKEDDIKLSFIMESEPKIKDYKIDLSNTRVLKIKIANISILVMVEIIENKKCYNIKSYFTNSWRITYLLKDTAKHIPISQFIFLEKDGLLADNLNSKKIIKDIKEKHNNTNNTEYINDFLLEALKAYDEACDQKNEIEYLIEILSEWLYEENKADYKYLNLAQVKYRTGKLNDEIITKIKAMKKMNAHNLEILAGINILLDNDDEAMQIINKMSFSNREFFKSCPIYNLINKKYASNKDF